MNPRRQEKAESWGAYYGDIAAWQHLRGLPEETAEQVAKRQAEAYEKVFELIIPPEEYPEWEAVFIKAYTAAYAKTLGQFQIHYSTPTGRAVTLYPKTEQEIKRILQRLAYRHIQSDLRLSGKGTERYGGSEPLDATNPNGRYTWFYEREPVEMRLR